MAGTTSLLDRYRGALVGLATGDALGTTLEFTKPGCFEPITDMVGGGPFALAPGQWTDDTSMALCLAESLIACHGFDPWDQLERYVRWWREGYRSSTGYCFDIGTQTQAALAAYEQEGLPYAFSGNMSRAGNGSLMRLAPVVMAYRATPQLAVEVARRSSYTTHAGDTAVSACHAFGALLLRALQGHSKSVILDPTGVESLKGGFDLVPEVSEVVAGSYRRRNPPEIRGSGYAVRSLEAALWAFWHSRDFREGALLAANLGEDADTTTAIYGQLAGAYYGVDAIPASWRERLYMRAEIVGLADRLFDLSERQPFPLPPLTVRSRDAYRACMLEGVTATVEGGPELAARMNSAIEGFVVEPKGPHTHEFEDRFDLDAIRAAWSEHGDSL